MLGDRRLHRAKRPTLVGIIHTAAFAGPAPAASGRGTSKAAERAEIASTKGGGGRRAQNPIISNEHPVLGPPNRSGALPRLSPPGPRRFLVANCLNRFYGTLLPRCIRKRSPGPTPVPFSSRLQVAGRWNFAQTAELKIEIGQLWQGRETGTDESKNLLKRHSTEIVGTTRPR
jgi:hypothetical protein